MQVSGEKIWADAQTQLRSMLSTDTYNLWFAPLRACSQDNSTLVLEVANDFCEVWLKDNYMGLLQDVVALASGRQLLIKFKVSPGVAPATTSATTMAEPEKPKAQETPAERSSSNHDLGFNP